MWETTTLWNARELFGSNGFDVTNAWLCYLTRFSFAQVPVSLVSYIFTVKRSNVINKDMRYKKMRVYE